MAWRTSVPVRSNCRVSENPRVRVRVLGEKRNRRGVIKVSKKDALSDATADMCHCHGIPCTRLPSSHLDWLLSFCSSFGRLLDAVLLFRFVLDTSALGKADRGTWNPAWGRDHAVLKYCYYPLPRDHDRRHVLWQAKKLNFKLKKLPSQRDGGETNFTLSEESTYLISHPIPRLLCLITPPKKLLFFS